jgi:hypothetical protein
MWDMLARSFLKEFLKPSSQSANGDGGDEKREYLCMKILKNNRLAAGSSDKSVHGIFHFSFRKSLLTLIYFYPQKLQRTP